MRIFLKHFVLAGIMTIATSCVVNAAQQAVSLTPPAGCPGQCPGEHCRIYGIPCCCVVPNVALRLIVAVRKAI